VRSGGGAHGVDAGVRVDGSAGEVDDVVLPAQCGEDAAEVRDPERQFPEVGVGDEELRELLAVPLGVGLVVPGEGVFSSGCRGERKLDERRSRHGPQLTSNR
jgi:hypothetical protein